MSESKVGPYWRVHVPSDIGPGVDHLVPNDLVGGEAPLVTLCGLRGMQEALDGARAELEAREVGDG